MSAGLSPQGQRSRHSFANLNIYLFGGRDSDGRPVTGEEVLWIYSTTSKTWRNMATVVPPFRFLHRYGNLGPVTDRLGPCVSGLQVPWQDPLIKSGDQLCRCQQGTQYNIGIYTTRLDLQPDFADRTKLKREEKQATVTYSEQGDLFGIPFQILPSPRFPPKVTTKITTASNSDAGLKFIGGGVEFEPCGFRWAIMCPTTSDGTALKWIDGGKDRQETSVDPSSTPATCSKIQTPFS
jgi:hypothetical protein